MRLYHTRNVASLALHYGATTALAAGAVILAQPWVIATSVVLSGGITWFAHKKLNEYLSTNLTKYTDVHAHSPKLGNIVKDLYQKSGLKNHSFDVYDFKGDKNKEAENSGIINTGFRVIFDQMSKTQNAAAFHVGKPIIMISEPLLKLLNDEEEKAVLAHEFTHAAARHSLVNLPAATLIGITSTAANITKLVAAFATGFLAPAAGLLGSIATKKIVQSLHADGALLKKPADDMPPDMRIKRASIKKMLSGVGQVAFTGIVAYFSPVYLAFYAAAKAVSTIGKVMQGLLKRSFEYQADRGAVTLGADPLALVTALRKMTIALEKSKADLGKNLPKKGWLTKKWKNLTNSHPTTERRIARLAKLARTNGASEDHIQAAVSGAIIVGDEHKIPPDVLTAMLKV